MIRFDGILFNEHNSRRIMAELARHDPAHAQLTHEQVAQQVSRCSFMSALAKLNCLAFFPRVAEFCDGTLHAGCDTRVMIRWGFAPLCRDGQDTLIVAIVNPWSLLPETYLASRFPQFGIVRIVTLAAEIRRAIVGGAVRRGANAWRGEVPR